MRVVPALHWLKDTWTARVHRGEGRTHHNSTGLGRGGHPQRFRHGWQTGANDLIWGWVKITVALSG